MSVVTGKSQAEKQPAREKVQAVETARVLQAVRSAGMPVISVASMINETAHIEISGSNRN